ncbi:MAG: T9SS type A sorting domain-containing protein, partial [Calditrichaeota bacterium]|nr:T9SS type A sorting domain-containing protein [Calditrichota bacterium]
MAFSIRSGADRRKPIQILLSCLFASFVGAVALAAWRGEPHRCSNIPIPIFPIQSHLDEDSLLYWNDFSAPYYFTFPDQFHDSLFNVRFKAPDACELKAVYVAFYLGPRDTLGNIVDTLSRAQSLDILVWSMADTDSVPGDVLGIVTKDWREVDVFDTAFFVLDLSTLGIQLNSAEWFHIGFSGDCGPGDTIAVFSDDGIPSTPYSGCRYDNAWHTIEYLWGRGYNLLIMAEVTLAGSGACILRPGGMPSSLCLEPPFPNPFNSTTTLHFTISTAHPVQLIVRDILGRTVATLAEGFMPAGIYSVGIDASQWTSGVYFA